jgi:hypothetical protein
MQTTQHSLLFETDPTDQLDYDLIRAERENGERIQREVQPHAA